MGTQDRYPDSDIVLDRVEQALGLYPGDFDRFFLLRFLGLEVSYGPGSCTVTLPTSPYMSNPQGTLHGGIIALAADVSMGHLCHRELSTSVTLDMNLRFLRPVTGPARCEARFLKPGRQVVHLVSEVYAPDDRLAAVATATWFRLPESPGGQP